jgi:hypothetical protein
MKTIQKQKSFNFRKRIIRHLKNNLVLVKDDEDKTYFFYPIEVF